MSDLSAALAKLSLSAIGKMSEDDARRLIERVRWPDGKPVCPHCGVVDEATLMESDKGTENKVRLGLYNCRACREPFTATVGTAMESSHIELTKWLMGFFLMASSKKGVSAKQLQRQLPLGSYKSAWFMAHRIRAAMANDPKPPKLSGIVEADETYIGGKPRQMGKQMREAIARGEMKVPPKLKRGRGTDKAIVQVLVQRGGPALARVVPDVKAKTLKRFIRSNVARSAAIHSDEFVAYAGLGKQFKGGHHTVEHGKNEYARGDVHANSAESFNGLFKRAIMGAWHHISREHMNRYLDEQCFRWTHREATDTERTVTAISRIGGARLLYKRPRNEEARGDGRVANG